MIDKSEFTEIIGALAALFPRFTLTPDTIRAYYGVLKDLPADLLKAATLEYATKDTPWFPSAGQLRSLAFSLIEHEEGQISAAEAWQEARKVLRDPSLYRPEVRRALSEDDFTDVAVYDAVKAIGASDIFYMTENQVMATRARFMTAFETFVNRRRMSQRMLPEVRRTVQLLADAYMPQIEAKVER